MIDTAPFILSATKLCHAVVECYEYQGGPKWRQLNHRDRPAKVEYIVR